MRSATVLLTTALVALAVAKPVERRDPSSYQYPDEYDCDDAEGGDMPTGMDPGNSPVVADSTKPVMAEPSMETAVEETPAVESPVSERPSEARQLGSAPPGGPVGSQGYKDAVLYYHNVHRANHTNTQPLVWSDKLAKTARDGTALCSGGHVDNDRKSYALGGYGQNYLGGTRAERIGGHLNDVYNDEFLGFGDQYGVADPRPIPNVGNGMIGHFTQMVWQGTKEIGCWTNPCGNFANTLCNFYPPGNYRGEYGRNVGRPLGKPVERSP